MAGAIFAPVGPWWTLDAPSLRLPGPTGRYVDVWTAGQGPSVLLVHGSDADHRMWQPLLPGLGARLTVHALQRRPGGPDAELVDLRTAVEGLGVRSVVAHGDAAALALGAALPTTLLLAAPSDVAATGPGVHRLAGPVDDPGSVASWIVRLLAADPG